MKKTNTKRSVKKIQRPVQINKNQIEMDKIANDMAVLFEKRITASELAAWLAVVNQHSDNPEEVREFIWNIGFLLLPRFIECDTKIKKIEFLKEELVNVFGSIGKNMLNESVGLIGVKYTTDFKICRSDAECVQEFMKPYTTFLCLCEMYDDYVFYKGELEKETKKAA
jgi:hypothetical protein